MSTTALVLTVLAMGLVTYLIRLVPIALFTRLKMPVWAQQTMRYVPTAVLAALIVPELLRPGGNLDISLGNARLLGGVIAIVVAWRTRNVLLTVVVGMVVLWAVQALF
jgi:branched-subunit amino acid transport protein